MALSAAGLVPGLVAHSSDVIQFYNLLTGLMTDQTVTLKNQLAAGGNQPIGNTPLKVFGVAGQTADHFDIFALPTDANPVVAVDHLGALWFGAGGATPVDTKLSRAGVGQLSFGASLLLQQGIIVANTPVIQASATWNNAGVNFTGIQYNATNTNSGAGTLLMDLQVAAASQFNVSKGGVGTFAGGLTVTAGPVSLPAASLSGAALVASSVPATKLDTTVARPNLLVNGALDIWQRTGPFTVNGAYTADRFQTNLGAGDTNSIVKDTTHQDTANGSIACAACTYVKSSGGSTLAQTLKTADGYTIAGRTFALSIRVNTATANAARALIQTNGTGGTNTFSSFHTGGSTYQTLTVTVTAPADATQVYVGLDLELSATVYFDSANLVYGSVAADLVPNAPADESARCLRYYEVLANAVDGSLLIEGVATAAGQTFGFPVQFAAPKSVIPTITIVGSWALVNCTGPTDAAGTSAKGLSLRITSVAAGQMSARNTNATNTVIAEANP